MGIMCFDKIIIETLEAGALLIDELKCIVMNEIGIAEQINVVAHFDFIEPLQSFWRKCSKQSIPCLFYLFVCKIGLGLLPEKLVKS